MIRTMMLAAGMATLLAAPAVAQSDRRDQGPPVMAGRDTMLRAGPEAGYPPVGRIEQGQAVQLFGCLRDRSWCDVGQGNARGWVSGLDLQADVGGRRDSLANAYGNFQLGDRDFRLGDYWDDHYRQQPFYGERSRWEQRYVQDDRQGLGDRQTDRRWGDRNYGDRGDGGRSITGTMLRMAYLRAGPDVAYPRIGVARARMRVTVFGCLRDWTWCDVAVGRDRGWLSSKHIGTRYRGRLQSLASIAPGMGVGVRNFSFGRYWDEHYRNQPFYAERGRWERQYQQNYRSSWGNGPERDGQYRDRRDRDERDDQQRDDRRPQPDGG
ncbi:SH3 domain-containing protein [Sandarakinorhabdus oryzae]|uniref:SH3 domain-containing protein n=1 Tax=Sandarakinorhabdus oryzae TaxID=2675220 RepID=UPI0012E0E26B|nr:SH3 domain-containing protein [Sandarakinorhabdus oryzae]